ncbi:MAG: phosphomannomutase/phosphoglucomutase, partial [Pyrinomonadaceae bacterium]|nr:phosphomannomutase/phosphoglucomutase [Pyrinomonadaceae bacterium]
MNLHIFREYDIRGLVGIDLTEETVSLLAKAIGTYFVNHGAKTVSLGYDARESSPVFCEIMAKNLNQTGLNVVNFGMIPTPLLYYTLFTEQVEAGIMITGSHNPAEFNGFKICLNRDALHGEEIQQIKEIVLSQSFAKGSGTIANKDITDNYLKFVKENIKLGDRKLKVVVDAGNGIGGIIGAPLYKDLGVEVAELFIEPDSNFPNHHPDPTVEKNLQDAIKAVKEHKADLAIAFDGDGDRIGAIDEKGNIIW